jgi:hypothetical protein
MATLKAEEGGSAEDAVCLNERCRRTHQEIAGPVEVFLAHPDMNGADELVCLTNQANGASSMLLCFRE